MDKQLLTLRERQLEYLRILKELDRFCTESNLRYYMGCGTLIGAVRHKGFIPWDDDLDVFVPRPDFMKMVKNYHVNGFVLHTIYNDKAHPFNFGRLCSDRVHRVFRNIKVYDFGIDVYVINGAPSDREQQLQHMNKVFHYIKRKEKLRKFRDNLVRHKLWPSDNLDFALMNKELIKAEEEFSKYDFESCDYIWPYGGGRLNMIKSNYGTPTRIPFEDGLFYAPEHYHKVLTLAYGNYMELPPEDQRLPNHGGSYYWT